MESYAKLAEIMELPEGHQIRCKSANVLKKEEELAKEREAGRNADKAKKSEEKVVVDVNSESFLPGRQE